jgi:hypothetical protein
MGIPCFNWLLIGGMNGCCNFVDFPFSINDRIK